MEHATCSHNTIYGWSTTRKLYTSSKEKSMVCVSLISVLLTTGCANHKHELPALESEVLNLILNGKLTTQLV